MIYLQLFGAFIQVGLFGFGGGYATIVLIQEKVVDEFGWLTLSEFSGLVSISQMTPGPIVINTATFVGIKIAGPFGAIVATLGSIIPSIIIVLIIAHLYKKYQNKNIVQNTLSSIRPVVVGLIGSAAFSLFNLCVFNSSGISSIASVDCLGITIIIAAFLALRKFKLNPLFVMASCAIGGLLYGIV